MFLNVTMRRKIKLLFLSQKLCPNLYNACSWPTFLSKEILCNISCLSKAGTHTHVLAVFLLVFVKTHRHIHTQKHTYSELVIVMSLQEPFFLDRAMIMKMRIMMTIMLLLKMKMVLLMTVMKFQEFQFDLKLQADLI